MKALFSRAVSGALLGLCFTNAGCSESRASHGGAVASANTGTLGMALEATSASGKVYRLRQAVFPIQGQSGEQAVLRSEDTPNSTVLETFLSPDAYDVTLQDGWFVEQEDLLLHTSSPVAATLTSPTTQSFGIQSEQETFVTFSFDVNGDRVQFGPPGRLIIGVGVKETEGGTTPPPVNNSRRALLESNQTAVSGFTLSDALEAAQTNSLLTPDPVGAYHQIIDSYASPGRARLPSGAHCGDQTTNGSPSLNGYPLQCDRLEAQQFDNLGVWFATAVVNRLDLAPTDGSHCGQERVVFANNAPIGNSRMFMILEAQIPNPHPECGIAACQPIATFWQNLVTVTDPKERGARLHDAFLTGSPELLAAGFRPFLSIENLSVGTGSVRTNNFDDGEWTLREFKLMSDPLGQTRVVPFPVDQAPHGALWNDLSAFPAGAACRTSFLQALNGLLSDDPAEMAFVVDQACLDAESPNDNSTQNYPFHLSQGSGAFQSALATALGKSGLTPQNVAARAQFAGSCIGCHEEANGVDLGRNVTSPFSNGFVQIDESSTEDCGDGTTCFRASPALEQVFLPRRQRALSELLAQSTSCVSSQADAGAVDAGNAPGPTRPTDAGAPRPPSPATDAGTRSGASVLGPHETLTDLVKQDQSAHDSLRGQTLGGQPAAVTH
jgi:hypothetical protein